MAKNDENYDFFALDLEDGGKIMWMLKYSPKVDRRSHKKIKLPEPNQSLGD